MLKFLFVWPPLFIKEKRSNSTQGIFILSFDRHLVVVKKKQNNTCSAVLEFCLFKLFTKKNVLSRKCNWSLCVDCCIVRREDHLPPHTHNQTSLILLNTRTHKLLTFLVGLSFCCCWWLMELATGKECWFCVGLGCWTAMMSVEKILGTVCGCPDDACEGKGNGGLRQEEVLG